MRNITEAAVNSPLRLGATAKRNAFYTTALAVGKWPASRFSRFIPGVHCLIIYFGLGKRRDKVLEIQSIATHFSY
jgi:hypothetical protein